MHYFFMQAHSFSLDDATVTEAMFQSVVAAFEEDRHMIEAQQKLIDRSVPRAMVGLPMDGALAAYRKTYEQLLAAEDQGRNDPDLPPPPRNADRSSLTDATAAWLAGRRRTR